MRSYRAGENVEDLCRACKIDRVHTVIAADGSGRPIRVQCDFCGSQHNYRGGASEGLPTRPAAATETVAPRLSEPARTGPSADNGDAAANRLRDPASAPRRDVSDLEALIRKVIREESGVTVVVPAEKWRDGLLVLRPGKPGLQDKSWPIETFFHKVVMIRNRLRTLEQQVNVTDLPEDAKISLQAYVTACYGSLTSFNVLFSDEDDHFKGSGD